MDDQPDLNLRNPNVTNALKVCEVTYFKMFKEYELFISIAFLHLMQINFLTKITWYIHNSQEVLKFWVQKGVKGFRLDAVLHLFEDESYQDNKEESHKYTQNQPETYDWIKDLRAFLTQLGGEDPNSEM